MPADLRRLDRLKSEALSLAFFEDERPLRGALGLVDWRLCGFLSREVRAGRVRGVEGEVTLTPTQGRLSVDKLFLFGLGPRAAFGPEVYEGCVRRMFRTLERAKVRSSVCGLPGRSVEAIEPEEAMERLLGVAGEFLEHDELTLLEGPDAQKAMEPVLLQERRRCLIRDADGF